MTTTNKLCVYCNQSFSVNRLKKHEDDRCEFGYTGLINKFPTSPPKKLIALFSIGDDCLQQSKTLANGYCVLTKDKEVFFTTFAFGDKSKISNINQWLNNNHEKTILNNASSIEIIVFVFVQSSQQIDQPLKIVCNQKNYVIRLKGNEKQPSNVVTLFEDDSSLPPPPGSITCFYNNLDFFLSLDSMINLIKSSSTNQKKIKDSINIEKNGFNPSSHSFVDNMQITPNFFSKQTDKVVVLL